MSNFKDLTGQKFGRLTVIKRVEKPTHIKSRGSYWLCKCECKNEKIIFGQNLKGGDTTSCGCYHVEISSIKKGQSSINRVYYDYKKHAIKKQVPFEISREYFVEITQMDCFYCGKKPSNISKNRYNNGDFIYNGIDRINSSDGYIKGNIVPCCWRCNEAKKKETQEDFLEWIKNTYDNLNNKGII